MNYLGEIRAYWRYLAAATIGQGAGYSFTTYTNNVFTPELIRQFGWARSSVALVGTAALLGIVCQPVAGRLTDAIGVRRMALVGVIGAPLIYLALGAQTGAFAQFFLLNVLQVIIVGGTTSTTVYSRLIAEKFDRARGLALGVVTCAPAAAGAVCVPLLVHFMATRGWRAGFVAVAVGIAIAGVSAILLIPGGAGTRPHRPAVSEHRSRSYRTIVRHPAFAFIILGMVLCNLSFSMQTTQLKVILTDQGVDTALSTWALSLFATSIIGGRLLCGLALDRLPAYVVAALGMGLPGIGLALLAHGVAGSAEVTLAVLLLGLSLGAEGDILAYLVMRYFRLEVYSAVVGLVLGAIALSMGAGSLLLSFMLKASGSYTSFLTVSAVAALAGGAMFLQLRRVRPAQ